MKTLTIINTILIIWILIAPYRKKFKFEIERTFWRNIPYGIAVWQKISHSCWQREFVLYWRNKDKINDKPNGKVT